MLARALWSPNGSEEDERKDALEQLAQNPGSAALARAAAYSIELARTPNGADVTLADAARQLGDGRSRARPGPGVARCGDA